MSRHTEDTAAAQFDIDIGDGHRLSPRLRGVFVIIDDARLDPKFTRQRGDERVDRPIADTVDRSPTISRGDRRLHGDAPRVVIG